MMLENTDYAQRAIDGKQAFEMIESEMPDLIILDLLLDQMKGEDFLKQLKSNPKYHIPIIIASSFSPRSYKKIFEVNTQFNLFRKAI